MQCPALLSEEVFRAGPTSCIAVKKRHSCFISGISIVMSWKPRTSKSGRLKHVICDNYCCAIGACWRAFCAPSGGCVGDGKGAAAVPADSRAAPRSRRACFSFFTLYLICARALRIGIVRMTRVSRIRVDIMYVGMTHEESTAGKSWLLYQVHLLRTAR